MREDLISAARSLRSAPGFTAVVLAVLALAIGAGTAIFSVVDAVVLRGLPFDEHDRIVAVLEHDTRRPMTFGGGTTTTQTYLGWRARQTSLEALAAVESWTFWTKDERGETSPVRGQRVTREFFPLLRVTPFMGRSFTAAEEIDGQHRVVILSYGYWQRRFGGAPDVLGKTIALSDDAWEIIGVMPPGVTYPPGSDRPPDLWAPVGFRPQDAVRGGGQNYNYTAIGRLKDGVSIAQAEGEIIRLMAAFEAEHPKWAPGRRARVITLHEHLVGRTRSWMLMLLAAVGLVLLIACANVANLLLARATVRDREMAIRAALGASRWRLVRALLVEGFVLSLTGAALGVAIAYAGVEILRAWLPPNLPRVAAIAIDLRVLGATIAGAFVTGILFGLVPALQSSRPVLTRSLKEGGRSATASRTAQRLRSGLVIAEMAVAAVLLVGAGLFIGSFVKLMQVDPGFDYRNLLVLNVSTSFEPGLSREAVREATASRGLPYVLRMLDAVSRVPGVERAAAVQGGVPITGSWSRTDVKIPGRTDLSGDDDSIDRRKVTPDYPQMLRVPLIAGRHLSPDDRESSPQVVVINEAAARLYWPGQNPLGQRIVIDRGENAREHVVVGVVGNIRHLGPEAPVRQECYVPVAQNPIANAALVIRTAGDPLQSLGAVKAAILSVNPDQRLLTDVVTLEAHLDRLIAQRRFNMALLTLFGVIGLVIAAIGLYGVMAYIVAQRTSEIGVRMALGATPGDVVRMVVRRAAFLMIAGLAIGLAGAWYLGAGVKAFLFEIDPNDARVFLIALGTLLLSGLLATLLPARRAARVDPLIALRSE